MGKAIAVMNFNYYDREKSNLAQILLEIYKASVNNGTYARMSELFDREVLSSKCFLDDKHADMDYLITFNNSLKSMYSISQEETVMEETHRKTM